MRAKWPSPQEFNEAIQNPQLCFADQGLRNGTVALNALGLPRVESGNFANVYKVSCPDGVFAVRCFTHQVADAAKRYALLSDFILNDDLIYTVSFHYQEQGIRVGGEWYPIVKMEWVEGEHFIPWIERNIENPHNITELAENFLTMTSDLQDAGIAHGDLQHGNVIVVGNDFRLVDYDGMFVPAMAGMTSNELGHVNFQHPLRTQTHFGAYLDNFSAWLIFASLEIIARDPLLWEEFGRPNGETILFTAADLRSPTTSPTFARLLSHSDNDIRLAANSIIDLLSLAPDNVPPPAVTHANLRLKPVKSPSWVQKIMRRAKKMVERLTPPKPAQSAPQPQEEQLPPRVAKQRPAPNPYKTPASYPQYSHPAPSQIDTPVQPKLHDYDVMRMLSLARKYSEAGKFTKAKQLLSRAQDAAKSGGYPAVILHALVVEAKIMADEADMHRDAHRFYEATTLYEKAILALRLSRQLRSGQPKYIEDMMETQYIAAVATIHKQHGRDVEAIKLLNEAIALLQRHPNTKADIARIEKLLPNGNNGS